MTITKIKKSIESDFKAGKLDHLISSAKKEFIEGKCQKLYSYIS